MNSETLRRAADIIRGSGTDYSASERANLAQELDVEGRRIEEDRRIVYLAQLDDFDGTYAFESAEARDLFVKVKEAHGLDKGTDVGEQVICGMDFAGKVAHEEIEGSTLEIYLSDRGVDPEEITVKQALELAVWWHPFNPDADDAEWASTNAPALDTKADELIKANQNGVPTNA